MHKHASANRFYRLVWSTVHRCWVAVAEGTRSHGKGAARRAAAVLAGSLAMAGASAAGAPPPNALPTGMQLVAGQAGVNVQGNSMTVSQATQQAIMNWQGFNIGADAQVRFNQPNASAVALNRVVDGEASAIFGKLSSNGKVFLVNPQGVLFGAGAQVNVGGLVASSLGISDQSFLSGSYSFSGKGTGAVRNEGSINAGGGVVALLAPAVSNSGSITAQGGSVALAAGNAVGLDFRGDGLITVRVEQGALDALAENKGLLQADGGQVLLSAKAADALARSTVNNAGVVQARGLVSDGGAIRLVGDGQVQAGQLDASSSTGQGGSVTVQGGFVSLDGALRADGLRGGSIDVKAGGDLSVASALSAAGSAGQGGSIKLVSGATLVENNAASASVAGPTDGGTMSLQAGGSLLSSGRHDARGITGQGGRVDISGADVRLLGATANASGATQGGLVRVGGAFQGGAQREDAPDADRFTARWGATANIANADATFINDSTVLDVSARGAAGKGGTAIVWSQKQTTMLGAVDATGAVSGGAVEISSHEDLRHVGLERLAIGAGGRLLLDPKNIVIGSFPNQWTYEAIIGKGFSGGKNRDVAGLKSGDAFGYSVALTSDGKGLAVGSPYDDGTTGADDANYGAVRLFTFTDSAFSGGALVSTIGRGYTGGKNVDISAHLTGADMFGSSVALSKTGDVLAVGAIGNDQVVGKVYVFGFDAGGSFTSAALNQTISSNSANWNAFGSSVALNGAGDKLAVGALMENTVSLFSKTNGNFGLASTIGGGATSDAQFGTAVALSDDASQLAVGAPGENSGKGMVYLYTTPFGTRQLAGTIGQGGSSLNISLNDGELFGSSLAMNDAGTRLAVGAPGNGGLNSSTTGPGAVRVFDHTNTFGAMNQSAVIGRDYTQGVNASLDLDDVGNFGFAIAMNGAGDSLVVAQPFSNSFDGSEAATGSIGFYRLLPAPNASSLSFDQAYPSASVSASVDAQKLAAALNAGTSITLQANNDITWNAANAIAAAGKGNLTLQAGRSVDLNSNISMGGTLTVVANAGTGAGVVSAHRDAGNATIAVAGGTTISADYVNLTIDNGAGQAQKASGDITIAGAVSGKKVTVVNQGTSPGSDVVINSGGRLVGTGGPGQVTVLVAAAGSGGGTFINNAGVSALQPGSGFYHVYADSPLNAVENVTGYNKHYDQSYTAGQTPGYAGSGNWFLYKLAPTLNVSAQNVSKVYDGTGSMPTPVYNVSGYIDGDTDNFIGSVVATGFSKNVGTYSLGKGSLANAQGYKINYTSGGTLTVTPKSLTVTATGVNKVYDGVTTAGATLGDNRVSGDQLTVNASSSTFGDKNAGNNKVVSVSGISVSGADAGNYSLASNTASTTATISQRTLNVSASAANKVYDGGVSASATLGDDRVGGDVLSVGQAGAAFANRNAGNGKSVTVSGLSLSGADAGNYALASASVSTTANITPRQLTVGLNASDKVYDGALAATGSYSDDRLNGDVLSVSGNAAFANKNAGNGKTVTATGLSLSGTDAGNYALASTTASGTASITPRALAVTASGNNKVYDGSNGATVSFADDRLAGDIFGISGSASFGDKNAATGKAISVTGIALTGADAGNYALSGNTASASGDITQRVLNVTTSGGNKTYDGSVAATVGLVDDRLSGDSLSLASASASFANKNAGSGKVVNVSGITLGGADAGNYALASTTATGAADISARSLTVTAAGIDRVYDGGTMAGVNFGDNRLGGDVLSVSGSAAFSNKNAGNGKTVNVSGIAISGADAGNYTLTSNTASATANIGQRTLNTTATGVNKVYDRSTTATVNFGDDRVSGDSLAYSYGSATFGDKNVGNGKAIGVSGIALSGTDAGNYVLASTSATASANITQRALNVGASASSKVYDGGSSAAVSYSDDRLAGDLLTVSGNASFANKNAGNGKTVTANGLALGGADAGNYALVSGSVSTTADITKRTLSVTADGISKVYDGSKAATLSFGDDRVAGDTLVLSGSGTFSDKNAGTGKTVTVSGISIGGSDAGNYQLSSTTASGTGAITPRALTVNVAASDKVYDGNTSTSVTLVSDDRIGADQLVLGGGTGSFLDKNAGTNKAVSLTGVSVGGADAGNYSISIIAKSTASITPRALHVSAAGIDKVYDGLLGAGVTFGDDRLAGDSLQISGNGAFADKNVGQGKAVSVSGIALSGTDAGNYSVSNSTANTLASITPKALTAVMNGALNKMYDGGTSAMVDAGKVGLSGFASGEGASVGTLQGQYNSANVAGANSVTALLQGGAVRADAGTALSNYVLPSNVTLQGSINARQVSIGGAAAASKTYDGTTSASLTNIGTLSGMVNGDTLNLLAPVNVQFDNRNAGSGKQVIASGYRLADGSGLASNYVLSSSSATATGTITAAQLVVRADDKVRAVGANNPGLTWTVTGLASGDTAALLDGVHASTNANLESPVGAYAIDINGNSLANYTVRYVNGVMTVIRPASQIDNVIGNTVHPVPAAQPGTVGQGGNMWAQLGPGEATLVAMPALIPPVNGAVAQVNMAGLLQRAQSDAQQAQGANQRQGTGEAREYMIGGGSRVMVRGGGVNSVEAPN
ncbi:YDG domain-containing protein [Pseudoduganella violaceinigra]|uniref:YDG domain-containing protein n=1 Tax=Pseudoduganella violaceinigra TaxID=246602 RepID=UPI000411387C|nr:YDG domain-containing protein [Pseudoduganella violaceinigra]